MTMDGVPEGDRIEVIGATGRVTGMFSTRAGALVLTERQLLFISEKNGVELALDRSAITGAKMGKANALVRIAANGQTHKFDFARTGSLAWFNASKYGFDGSVGGSALGAIGNIVAVTKGREAAKPFIGALAR